MKKILLVLLPLSLLGSVYAQDVKTETYDTPKQPVMKLKNEIFYLSPIKFSENGVGFDLGYEKGIDQGGIVAYNLPLMVTFNMSNSNANNGNKQDPMFYFMPGIKFYPTSSYGKVKYAIGPSIVFGAGQKTESETIYPGSIYPYPTTAPVTTYVTKSKFVLGVTVNNSLNINPSPHFTLGIDFGFGFTYLYKLDGNTQGMTGLVNGGFRMGYRL